MNPEQILTDTVGYITDPGFLEQLVNILIVCAGLILAGSLLRLIFGKRSIPVKAVSATMAILVMYCVLFLLQRIELPAFFRADLPFVAFTENSITVTPLLSGEKNALWVELVDLIILVIFCGLLEDLLPQCRNFFGWVFFKAVSIAAAFAAFCAAKFLFNLLLPDLILNYAPIILLALLALFLAVTVFKWLIGVILGVTGGPILGAVYTFFISSVIGKQLTKSAFSGGIVVLLVYLAERFSFTQVVFTDPLGTALIPVIFIICLVWYLLCRVF